MKLNLKNLTACMAISLGTICSVNAMQENIIVQNSRIDSTVAALMSDPLAYNDENDPMIMTNAQRLVAKCRGQNVDKILKFKIDEHLARRRCAQILKRIHRACGRFDMENIQEVDSSTVVNSLPIIIDSMCDSFTYTLGWYNHMAYVFNDRKAISGSYSRFNIRHTSGDTQTIINEHSNAYALMVAFENGLERDKAVVNAAYNSMLMKLTERVAHGFVNLAYALENLGGIDKQLFMDNVTYVVGSFIIPPYVFNYMCDNDRYGDLSAIHHYFYHDNIDARLAQSWKFFDLSYNGKYSVALKNLCERNGGTLQGVINAVCTACKNVYCN